MKGMLGVALCLLVGCSQEVDDVVVDAYSGAGLMSALIAQKAIKRKTGARGLRSIIENILRDIM